MDEVSAYPCVGIGCVPEVLETAPRKIIEEHIIMVHGGGKASMADCGSGYTRRALQKGPAIDEALHCIHISTKRSDETPRSNQINVRRIPSEIGGARRER